MSTITREFTKEQLIEHAKKHIAHDVWLKDKFAETHNTPATVELARIALASLEADPVYFVEIEDGQDINAGRIEGENRPDLSLLPDGINHLYAAPPAPANAEPLAWLWSHRKHPSEVTLVRPEDDEKAEGAHWSGWSCQALYAEHPAPVSVPDDEQCKPHPVMAVKGELGFLDHLERIIDERDDDIEIGRLSSSNGEALMLAALDAFRASIQKGVEPVTIKANGVSSENDEPPERGWVVTHSGKDYFYREQGDAATHMNAAVESGQKVSLRSFIPETVTAAYKSPDSWMACRDQNPEKGRHLALFGKRTKENCDPYVDEGYLGSDGEFYFFDWEGGPRINDCHPYDKAEVTHWMYRDLPAAPQQEVNNGN